MLALPLVTHYRAEGTILFRSFAARSSDMVRVADVPRYGHPLCNVLLRVVDQHRSFENEDAARVGVLPFVVLKH